LVRKKKKLLALVGGVAFFLFLNEGEGVGLLGVWEGLGLLGIWEGMGDLQIGMSWSWLQEV